MSTNVNKEKWFVKHWRPAAAWIYLSICVFDFVAMPIYHLRSQGDLDRIVEISMQLRPEDRLNAIVQLSRKTTWEPLTLGESGMFHIAFGAILGVAAWTRGRVQEQIARNQPRRRSRYDDELEPDDDPYVNQVNYTRSATSDTPPAMPTPKPPRRSAPIDMSSF